MTLERNYDIPGFCIKCGKTLKGDLRGTTDHYFPECISGSKAERRRRIAHPFLVVVGNPNNLFRICCKEEHEDLDSKKIEAFLGLYPEHDGSGIERGDPVALIKFLMEHYPIAANPRFRALQIRRMIAVNNHFKKVAIHLNGELDRDLVERYKEAAAMIRPFNNKLHNLRSSSLGSCTIDLEADN